MLAPPESPGRAGPQAPPCARTFRVGFAKSEPTRTTTRARARLGAGLRSCVRSHRGTPILGHAGPTLWFPQALGAGVTAPESPRAKKKLLEFQERDRTESRRLRAGWEGAERTPAVTSSSGRHPQHSVSGPHEEPAATRGPRRG